MKNLILILVSSFTITQSDLFSQRMCDSYAYLQMQNQNETIRENRQSMENKIQEFLRHGIQQRSANVYTIRVVFHIVMQDPTDVNLAQIQSQLDVLNKDYRALNADISNVPAVFQNLVSDSEFEFKLAHVGPDCNGITRTVTTVNCFDRSQDNIKRTSAGGHDPIDPENLLNIWVGPICNASGPIRGYAQFPGGAVETDGVVISPDAFGTNGTATAPYDLGRTTTHEIGHYFNLNHIWGDDNGACTGDDHVDDTPNQGGFYYGCPDFPNISCQNGPNGDLFVNYMEYVDDDCMHMFTVGQSARMTAALFISRPNLIDPYICCSGTINMPMLSTYDITVSCPFSGINLNELHIGTIPSGASLIWSTDADPTDGISPQIDPLVFSLGTYYAYYLDEAEYCYGPASQGVEITHPSSFDIHITTNTPYNSNMEIFGNLYIENDATLTITSTIKFGPDSKIIVESNSKLLVDGGTLTACSEMWQGVEVAGQFDLGSYSPAGSSNLKRGYVDLKNGAVIEKAIVGINGRDLFIANGDIPPGMQFYHGGGKITISSGSIIQDCGIGVRLHRYGWGSVIGTGTTGPGYPIGYEDEPSAFSNSFFKNCDAAAIYSDQNIGLSLVNNEFGGNYTDYEGYHSSITATGNDFTSFMFIASEYPVIPGSTFTNNTFTNSVFGIDGQGNIKRHKFNLNTVTASSLYLSGELLYGISDNEFTNGGNIGLFTESTGESIENWVIDNAFSGQWSAISVFGENDTEFLANCFSSTTNADIEINSGASIHMTQGSQQTSAGNCFNYDARIKTGNGISPFNYWTKDGFDPQCHPVSDCKYPGSCNGFTLSQSQEELEVDCETNIIGDPPSELNCECGTGQTGCTDAIASVRTAIAGLGGSVGDVILKAQYKRCLDKLIRTYVDTALASGQVEASIDFLSTQPEFRYRIMAYGIMTHNLEYDRASDFIDTLATSKAEEQGFVNVQKIWLSYLTSIDTFKLSAADSITIRTIGEAHNPLAGYARTVFYKLTGERITRDFIHTDSTVTQRSSSEVIPTNESKIRVEVHVWPNPVTGQDFEINVEGANPEKEYLLVVYDALGVLRSETTVSNGVIHVPISETPGIYFVCLLQDGECIHTKKVVRI